MQTSPSLNSLNTLRMRFSHFLPKAMFPCHLCHRRVASCDCWESRTVNLNCQNPVQIIRSLVMLMLERGGKGIGCDTTVKPDRLGEHHWERERQDRMKEGICLIYTQSSRAFHFPWKTVAVGLKWTIHLMVLWWCECHGFSNEYKSKQNKITKFLGYLWNTFLTSLLISLLFKFVQGICANDHKLLRLFCW